MFKKAADKKFEIGIEVLKDLSNNMSTSLKLSNLSVHDETSQNEFLIKYDRDIIHIYDDLKNGISFINLLNKDLVKNISKSIENIQYPRLVIVYCPKMLGQDKPQTFVWDTRLNSFGDYGYGYFNKLDEEFLTYADEDRII